MGYTLVIIKIRFENHPVGKDKNSRRKESRHKNCHFFFFYFFFLFIRFSCNSLEKFTFMHFFINKKFKNSKMLIITTIS
jgi:hypothetical protein